MKIYILDDRSIYFRIPQLLLVILACCLVIRLLVRIRRQIKFSLKCKIPRPSVGAYSLVSRIYRSDPSETSRWLNDESKKLKTALLHVTGPFFMSNIIAMSPSAIRTISKGNRIFVKPSTLVNFFATFTGPLSIITAEGMQHRRLRKAITPALRHDHIVTHIQKIFFLESELLCESLSIRIEKEGFIDPVKTIRKSAFRVVAESCFGYGFLSPGEMDQLFELYHQALSGTPFLQLVRLFLAEFPISIPFHWISSTERSKKHLREMIYKLCNEIMTQKKNCRKWDTRYVSEGSLLDLVLTTDIDLSTEELSATVLSFLLAGQATSTMALSWGLHILGKHPEWQCRINKELDGKGNGELALDELDGLPNLDIFLKELIRLYPPMMYTQRTVQNPSGGGVDLENHFLPNGTNIRIPILALQLRADIWGGDAEEFNPERWNKVLHPDAKWMWAAFWHGTRGCVGQRFAMLEMKVFLAALVSRFHISVDNEKHGEPYRWGINSTPQGMKLHFKRLE